MLLSFCVSSAGCHVFLPGGAELLFPPGCLATTTRLEWVEIRPERKWVWLEEHDVLLSLPLELRPHGITFLKVLYHVCYGDTAWILRIYIGFLVIFGTTL